jgi:hypothetical protein
MCRTHDRLPWTTLCAAHMIDFHGQHYVPHTWSTSVDNIMCHDRLPWTTLCAARRRWRPSPIWHTPCFRLFQKTRPQVGFELSVASLAVTPMTTRPKDSQSVLVGLLHMSLLNLTLSGGRRFRPLPSTPVPPKEKALPSPRRRRRSCLPEGEGAPVRSRPLPSPRRRRRSRPPEGGGACFYSMFRTHNRVPVNKPWITVVNPWLPVVNPWLTVAVTIWDGKYIIIWKRIWRRV